MTGRLHTTHVCTPTSLHPAQADFFVARLSEELDAALLRPFNKRALRMLADLREAITSRQEPDQMSIDILTVAYAGHPEFRTDWHQRRCS